MMAKAGSKDSDTGGHEIFLVSNLRRGPLGNKGQLQVVDDAAHHCKWLAKSLSFPCIAVVAAVIPIHQGFGQPQLKPGVKGLSENNIPSAHDDVADI
jgi:hypothetical protein